MMVSTPVFAIWPEELKITWVLRSVKMAGLLL
jgi:hypothetical protein